MMGNVVDTVWVVLDLRLDYENLHHGSGSLEDQGCSFGDEMSQEDIVGIVKGLQLELDTCEETGVHAVISLL